MAVVGGCLGAGFGALRGGTWLSALLSGPIAVYGLIMSVVIMGQIPAGQNDYYCSKVGYAHFHAGFALGGSCIAGGIAIGMTKLVSEDCAGDRFDCPCTCMYVNVPSLLACRVAS
jgi:hypothetical protein